jgi:DNA polymerase-4
MKKPNAITEISAGNFREKIWPLDWSEMIYCGPATTRKLASYGIHTIGDVAQSDPTFLKSFLGINGVALWNYANGTDTSRVMHRDFVSPIKSVGHGITCTSDLENDDEVFRIMLSLSQDVGHRLRVHELSACGVQISVRSDDLFGVQYQCKLPMKTQLPSEIASAGFRIFKERYSWNSKVRAVCIRAIDLVPKNQPEQLTFFDDIQMKKKRDRLEDAVESIRSRFGKNAVTYATLLGDLKMPNDGRDSVKMPGMMYQ